MKRKSDFVTNSSSTSYLVHIPGDFNILEHTDTVKDAFEFSAGVEAEPEDLKKIEDLMMELKMKGEIYQYDNYMEFYTIIELLSKFKYVITSWDCPSDSGILINSNSIQYQKQIREIGD